MTRAGHRDAWRLLTRPRTRTDVAAARLGALFDAHHQRLFRLARRLSRSADDARDLVQETFLRAARRPASVPAGASTRKPGSCAS